MDDAAFNDRLQPTWVWNTARKPSNKAHLACRAQLFSRIATVSGFLFNTSDLCTATDVICSSSSGEPVGHQPGRRAAAESVFLLTKTEARMRSGEMFPYLQPDRLSHFICIFSKYIWKFNNKSIVPCCSSGPKEPQRRKIMPL